MLPFISDFAGFLFYPLVFVLPLLTPFLLLTVYSKVVHKKITFRQKACISVISYLPFIGIWLVVMTFLGSTFFMTSRTLFRTIIDQYGAYALTVGVVLNDLLFVNSPTVISETLIGFVTYLTLFAFLVTIPVSIPLVSFLLVVSKNNKPPLLVFETFWANLLLFLLLSFLVMLIGATIFSGYLSQTPL